MRPEGMTIQTRSSAAFALVRAINSIGLDLRWMQTSNNGSHRSFAEQFSWTAVTADAQGRIDYPANSLLPSLDYEYSVSTPQSGGILLLTNHQESIADPRLELSNVSVGIGCNFQRIHWHALRLPTEQSGADDYYYHRLRLQVIVTEIDDDIEIVYNNSFSVFETVLVPDGVYRPSTAYWVTVYLFAPGPVRHHGAHITQAFVTCDLVASLPPLVTQIPLANDSAMAFQVSWDCSHLGTYPAAIVLDYHGVSCNGTSHVAANSSDNGSEGNNNIIINYLLQLASNNTAKHMEMNVSLQYEDLVVTSTLCSANFTVPNLFPKDYGVVSVAAALRFPAGNVVVDDDDVRTSAFGNATNAYKYVAKVHAPNMTLDEDCLEMKWHHPSHAVAAIEVQVSSVSGLTHYELTLPGTETSTCLSLANENDLQGSDAALQSNNALDILASRLLARYRAVSPAGPSEWSHWVESPLPLDFYSDKTISPSSPSSDSLPIATLAGAVAGAVVGMAVVVLIAFKRMRKPERSHIECALIELKQFTPVVKPKLINHKHIKMLQSIGEGKFGQVVKGVWRAPGMHFDATVAVKTLHDGFPEEATRAFAIEACVMVSDCSVGVHNFYVCFSFSFELTSCTVKLDSITICVCVCVFFLKFIYSILFYYLLSFATTRPKCRTKTSCHSLA